MSLLNPKEGVDAGGNVLLCSGEGQRHVVLPQVTLQAAAEVVGKPRLAPHIIIAQGPEPGGQVHPGHKQDEQKQDVVGRASLSLHKHLITHHPGQMQQGHIWGTATSCQGASLERLPVGRVEMWPVPHPS